jgi:beta-lactam-binding protein with PASTA domain
LQQDPLPNTVVVHGTTFNLVLVASRAGKATNDADQEFSTQVPKLTGLTLNQASNLLERHRLGLGSVLPANGKGPDGTIYDQKPRAESWVRIGSKVDVGIVQTPKTSGSTDILWVFVPDLTGQTQKAAEEILRKQNLTVDSISSGVASVPVGTVFWQHPLPNTRVAQGSRVDLRIAQAPPSPPAVTVPDLFQQDVESARSLLGQSGLQLGQVTREESDNPANSILSQSPTAGTPVERGSAVDVKIAQPIPTISVPDIVQHEEKDAISILRSVGLRLGTVDEKINDTPTGTVLLQKPDAGAQVPKGTAIDVTLSQQPLQFTVLVNPTNPTKGQRVRFHAHLEPAEKGMQYRFYFGDRTDSGWLPSSSTTHIYQEGGDFLVRAVATRGATTLNSEEVTVRIPSFPWELAAVASGLLVLGGLGFSHWRRMRFRRLIRVTSKMDAGAHAVSVNSHEGRSPCARIRLCHDAGKGRVLFKEK